MQPQFQNEVMVEQTPPAHEINRKNQVNQKQKQSKQAKRGSPYEESGSSEKKSTPGGQQPKKQDMASLDDLPGLGGSDSKPQQHRIVDNDYDFGGFDDFDDSENQNE